MRRRLLGIIALLLVIGGIAGLVFGEGSGSQLGLFASACVRAGTVLGALWLAFPKIEDISNRVPPQLLGALLLGALAIAIRPRTITVVVPLLAILVVLNWMGTILKPRKRRG
jgi:hypothetical protein